MSHFYVATAHPPTSVKFAVTANFTSPTVRNLIVAKFNTIEIFNVTPEGLQPELEFSLYGEIIYMSPITFRGINL